LGALLAAGVGVAVSPWLRGLLFAHSVAYGCSPRGRCPGCGGRAVWVALWGLAAVAPVRGRCRWCGLRIGPRFGGVEAVAALALAVLAWKPVSGWVLAAWGWAALLGVALAAVDLAVLRLPDTLTLAAFVGALMLLSVAAVASGEHGQLARAALCAAGLGGVCLAPVLASATRMGRGDGQLATASSR
jgi:leader peptidase (prepilin peptidase)/N-methyltransferase